jgi:hypothetical protein
MLRLDGVALIDTRGMSDMTAVLSWAVACQAPPVPVSWVPGATEDERRTLAGIGHLFGEVSGPKACSVLANLDGAEQIYRWLKPGPGAPADVILAGERILELDGHAGLATLYALAVSGANRRRLGTFFTPLAEVDWIFERWESLVGAPHQVIDVGAGVGAFSIAAAKRWRGANIAAVDVNPVTLGLLFLIAQREGLLRKMSRAGIDLVHKDFVAWLLAQDYSRTWPRLITGNPPYTRMQLLPGPERQKLRLAVNGLVGSRASLSAYMTAASLISLAPQDGLCLLLPSQWLESSYARELRDWLWRARSRRVEIHLFGEELFSEAQVDAAVLLVGPHRSRAQPLVTSSSGSTVADRVLETTHDRENTNPDSWRQLFSSFSNQTESLEGPVLRDFVTVRRGVATGANKFFTFSLKSARELELPDSVCRDLVLRLRDFPGDDVTLSSLNSLEVGRKRFLFVAGSAQSKHVDVSKYLGSSEGLEAQESFLAGRRRDWFNLSAETFIPDVIVGPATKGAFRFVENSARAFITNNLYGLTWLPGVADSRRSDVLSWLRSEVGQTSLSRIARQHSGGLKKIELNALASIVLAGLHEVPHADAGSP